MSRNRSVGSFNMRRRGIPDSYSGICNDSYKDREPLRDYNDNDQFDPSLRGYGRTDDTPQAPLPTVTIPQAELDAMHAFVEQATVYATAVWDAMTMFSAALAEYDRVKK